MSRNPGARARRIARRLFAGVLVAVLGGCLVLAAGDRPADGSASAGRTVAAPADPTSPPATGLDPGLVEAFERARTAAAAAGHELTITSGFRTAEEQAAMLAAEVGERGSLEEARWWVFPPDRSMHVQGLAIDVGDGPAADWLAATGARFGLCRVLAWEWWHFEWRQRWEDAAACPAAAQVPEDAPGR